MEPPVRIELLNRAWPGRRTRYELRKLLPLACDPLLEIGPIARWCWPSPSSRHGDHGRGQGPRRADAASPLAKHLNRLYQRKSLKCARVPAGIELLNRSWSRRAAE